MNIWLHSYAPHPGDPAPEPRILRVGRKVWGGQYTLCVNGLNGYRMSRGAAVNWEAFRVTLGQVAGRLGIVAMGVVAARRFEELAAYLDRRRQEGSYPLFCPQDVELRTDPERWLAGCRSLWVAAVPYAAPRAAGQAVAGDGSPTGRIAAYALPEDYHRELKRRLRWLAAWASRKTGLSRRDFRVFVDTGPPVERHLWQLSGAGWIGKNTCAYAPGAGSWVVLGVVASRLPLPPGPIPVRHPAGAVPSMPTDACAGCSRCIEACPTGALTPYRMEPQRCIAQFSQRRGALAPEERERLHGWLFGCDLCQMACPYNRPEHAPLAFRPDAALWPVAGMGTRVPLADVLSMDEATFRAGFGRGAASWRGLAHLQKNAAYVAGALRRRLIRRSGVAERATTGSSARRTAGMSSPTPHESLERLLQRLADAHPSPVVRDACAWALEAFEPPREAAPPLPAPPTRPGRRHRPCRTRPSDGTSPPGPAIPGR